VTRLGAGILSFVLALLVVLGGAITLLLARGIDALLDRTG
jgi:hypothetical protein